MRRSSSITDFLVTAGLIENPYGKLVARWRIFHTSIQTSVETAAAIIQAAICLHNYLRQTYSAAYCLAGCARAVIVKSDQERSKKEN